MKSFAAPLVVLLVVALALCAQGVDAAPEATVRHPSCFFMRSFDSSVYRSPTSSSTRLLLACFTTPVALAFLLFRLRKQIRRLDAVHFSQYMRSLLSEEEVRHLLCCEVLSFTTPALLLSCFLFSPSPFFAPFSTIVTFIYSLRWLPGLMSSSRLQCSSLARQPKCNTASSRACRPR